MAWHRWLWRIVRIQVRHDRPRAVRVTQTAKMTERCRSSLMLGGDRAAPGLLRTLDGNPGITIQSSTTSESLETAARLALSLPGDMRCEWAVITTSKAGAAGDKRGVLAVPAFRAHRYTDCARAGLTGACSMVYRSPGRCRSVSTWRAPAVHCVVSVLTMNPCQRSANSVHSCSHGGGQSVPAV